MPYEQNTEPWAEELESRGFEFRTTRNTIGASRYPGDYKCGKKTSCVY